MYSLLGGRGTITGSENSIMDSRLGTAAMKPIDATINGIVRSPIEGPMKGTSTAIDRRSNTDTLARTYRNFFDNVSSSFLKI